MRLLLPAILAAVVSAGPLALRGQVESKRNLPTFIAGMWFAEWHASNGYPVSSIDFSKFNHVQYGFVGTTADVNALTDPEPSVIQEFVTAAHNNGATACISVGGWDGSRYFSTAVATAENRTAFVNTLSSFVSKWGFDGINIDWEYPNHQGTGCNTISPDDSANFLLFLQELRSKNPQFILSAATSNAPWMDASGTPLTNVVPFARVLDFIEPMNYDIFGRWSSVVGPNSPLDDSCAPPGDQMGSATSAFKAWTKAGMPSEQIVIGVASYGHSFSVSPASAYQGSGLAPYPPFDSTNQPPGDKWDAPAGPDICGLTQPAGGVYTFSGLIDNHFLTSTGEAAPGIDYRFDSCSKTAYVYNNQTHVEVSFDDAPAFTAKGNFIKSNFMRGFSMYEAGGDFNNLLVDAIRSGAGV